MNKRIFGSILAAALIAISIFVMGTSGNAEAATSNCQRGQQVQVHGYLITQVVSAGQTQGTIIHGGLLNGTTQDQIVIDPSTNPNVTTYTATWQDTTEDGTIVTHNTGAFFSDGNFLEEGTIDGAASTGAFAGATGSLEFVGSSKDGIHFTATVSGTITIHKAHRY